MIKVKDNLTEEQIKKFSETREFGILDKAKRSLRRGKDRLVNKMVNADKAQFKAGVVYLEAKMSPTSISYRLDHKGTDPKPTAKEANADIDKVINEIWSKNPKGIAELSGDKTTVTRRYPVIIMKAVNAGNYETEIKEEIKDAMETDDWKKLMTPKIKTIKGKMQL